MGQSGDIARAMSQVRTKTLQGVRLPPAREARQHRTLDERILVRFPALGPRLVAAWMRLPRPSRLRRAMLVRLVRQGYAAVNRRDFDLTVTSYDPGYEYHPDVGVADADPVYYGHDGFHKFWRQLLEAFDDVRLDPKEILDLGDQVLVTTQMSGHGTGSGVSLTPKAPEPAGYCAELLRLAISRPVFAARPHFGEHPRRLGLRACTSSAIFCRP
jgi:hypothetical protein